MKERQFLDTMREQSNESLYSEAIGEIPVAEMAYASRWNRFTEFIIDSIVVVVILFVVIVVIICGTNLSNDEGELFMMLSAHIVFCSYFFFLETLYGKTIGKMLLGTTVVDINGEKPKMSRIGWRTLCRYIPYESFSFLFGGWKGHKLSGHWHDSISKTYVVDDKKLREMIENKAI